MGLADKIKCYVTDKNATKGPRTHNIEGTDYTLYAERDKALEIPYAHAKYFMRIPSFDVRDEKGNRMAVQDARERRFPMHEIPPHLTVAAWDELTKEALLKRASETVGTTINPKVSKDDLIDLLSNPTADARAAAANRDEIEGLKSKQDRDKEAARAGREIDGDPDLVDDADPDEDGEAEDMAAKLLAGEKNPVTTTGPYPDDA